MAKTNVGLLLVLAGALAVPAVGSSALAKDGDVIVRAACSAGSTAKLKLSGEAGSRIEAEVEVDQNRNGVPWTVVLTRDGVARCARDEADESSERVVHAAAAGRQPSRSGCDPRRRDPTRGALRAPGELGALIRW